MKRMDAVRTAWEAARASANNALIKLDEARKVQELLEAEIGALIVGQQLDPVELVGTWGLPAMMVLRRTIWRRISLSESARRFRELRKQARERGLVETVK